MSKHLCIKTTDNDMIVYDLEFERIEKIEILTESENVKTIKIISSRGTEHITVTEASWIRLLNKLESL